MRPSKLVLMPALFGLSVALTLPPHGLAEDTPRDPEANVEAQNRAAAFVHVSVLQGGHMVPVGFVDAEASETLTIPSFFFDSDEPIHLVADPVGLSEWYKSAPLSVEPGSALSFTIEPDVTNSEVVVQ